MSSDEPTDIDGHLARAREVFERSVHPDQRKTIDHMVENFIDPTLAEDSGRFELMIRTLEVAIMIINGTRDAAAAVDVIVTLYARLGNDERMREVLERVPGRYNWGEFDRHANRMTQMSPLEDGPIMPDPPDDATYDWQ